MSSRPPGSVRPLQTPAGTWLRADMLEEREEGVKRQEIAGKRDRGRDGKLAFRIVMMTCEQKRGAFEESWHGGDALFLLLDVSHIFQNS